VEALAPVPQRKTDVKRIHSGYRIEPLAGGSSTSIPETITKDFYHESHEKHEKENQVFFFPELNFGRFGVWGFQD